ncbi:acyltransferase family protein [Aeromicrobium fastidiosum]|uniref:Acyltransferase n=1 Tax=Aeromicrobium fastidiosum TaxID=52699 RepID=A0A641ATB0_9ACTN|nr:acyltransferase [Aeromicrobium fastidiosum]KAA1380473.1 acyltransferase [Aeromicrobium fastidiosum]MBP2390057.1 peptidoglycan/LPS O-acetylase OafA/YrhL [Aeromicrobium fastidiosum]
MAAKFGAATSSSGRYAHIDAMRALSVMIVVVAHAGLGRFVPGGSGVTVFFTISGFIITHLVLKEWRITEGFNIGGFYLRRLLKLGPPFVVVVVIPTLVYMFFEKIDVSHFVAQIFFVFNWVKVGTSPSQLDVLPGSGVVWSLSIEEQFYVVFALAMVALVRSTHLIAILTAAGVVAAVAPLIVRLLLVTSGSTHARTYYGSDTRLDAIAIGVLLAVWFFVLDEKPSGVVRPISDRVSSFLASPAALALAIGVFAFALIYRDPQFRETFRYTCQGLSAAMVIAYGFLAQNDFVARVFRAISGWTVLRVIGLASYSIYLVHLIIIIAAKSFLVDHIGGQLATAVLILVGVGAGVLIWKFVEQPVLRLRQR